MLVELEELTFIPIENIPPITRTREKRFSKAEIDRRYRERHQEKLAEWHRQYYQTHKQRWKKYYNANKDHINELRRKRRLTNLEKYRKQRRNWDEAHPVRALAHNEAWSPKLKEYNRQNVKTTYFPSLGRMMCPRCGEEGYGQIRQVVNVKTGVKRQKTMYVKHQKYTQGKVINSGCYIGMLDDDGNLVELPKCRYCGGAIRRTSQSYKLGRNYHRSCHTRAKIVRR